MYCLVMAIMALTPENNMATLLEISEDMARRLGRASLVQDYNGGDFTPKPLFRNLINDAHEWLDLNYRPERPMEELEVALAAGQADFSVAGIKWVNSMALAGEPREPLQYIDYGDLKRLRDVSTPGVPKYWARQVKDLLGQTVEAIENGGFATDLSGWTAILASWSNGKCVLEGTGSIEQSVEIESAGTYTFSIDIESDVSTLQVTIDNVPEYSVVPEGAGTHTFQIALDTGTYVFKIGNIGTIDNVSLSKPVTIPSLPIPWFSLAPAPSQAQSLFVLGSRYSPVMTANSDETWWSATHPAILKKAIRREVESELNRNQGEVEKIELELRKQLRQLEAIEVFERSRGDADDWRIMP